MNRILNIPAKQLHPGDRIIAGLDTNAVLEVRAPGVITAVHLPNRVPYGTVEVCVYGPDPGYPWTPARVHMRPMREDRPLDIDRPNLVIPGLEDR
jgi:hypothetical protein